ncbi:hypothetical protein PM082_000636 [Marasmius tenuissimus]|nr:hypothetical protein PM082_000636 [Marasmius tenuissimus]
MWETFVTDTAQNKLVLKQEHLDLGDYYLLWLRSSTLLVHRKRCRYVYCKSLGFNCPVTTDRQLQMFVATPFRSNPKNLAGAVLLDVVHGRFPDTTGILLARGTLTFHLTV